MILNILCFLLGIHLSMTLIAACYRIIDLWYRIDEFLGQISQRLALVVILNAIVILWLEDSRQIAFISGQLLFLVFHVFIYWVGRIMVYFLSRN